MKVSYFNFSVAVWCAAVAAFLSFSGADLSLVMVNIMLAIFNLWVGLTMQKQGR